VPDRRERVTLDAALLRKLRAFIDRRGATIYIAALTALAAAFHVATRKTRVVVWSPFANRTRPETEGIIGWFANSHILGVRCVPERTLIDLFLHVREVVLQAQRHQEVPIATVRAALTDACVMPHGMPVDVLNLALDQTFAPRHEQVAGLRMGPVRGERDSVLGGLRLMIVESADQIEVMAMYAAERLLPIHIAGLLATMTTTLDALVETPDLRLADLGRATSPRRARTFRRIASTTTVASVASPPCSGAVPPAGSSHQR
jgi:non-ribosomal peptide synthetase component F